MYKFLEKAGLDPKLSPFFSFVIEISSTLQIGFLILQVLLSRPQNSNSFFYRFKREIEVFLAFGTPDQYLENYNFYKMIWYLSMVYLCLHVLLLVVGFFIILINKRMNKFFLKIIAITYLLHGRIIFFLIQMLLLSQLNFFINAPLSAQETSISFSSGKKWLILIITLSLFNFSLAFIKEFVFYSVAEVKNVYSVKTNLYHQMVLFYKTMALVIHVFAQNVETLLKLASISHFLFIISLLLVLYRKLPFFHFGFLRIIIIANAVLLSLAFASILQTFQINVIFENEIELVCLLLHPLTIKILLSLFRRLFQQILTEEYLSNKHAIHYLLLLKQAISKNEEDFSSSNSFFPSICSIIGIFKSNNLGTDLRKKQNRTILYDFAVQKLTKALDKNAKSQVLLIFIAQIYLKKLNNVPKAIELIQRVESLKQSISIKISIRKLYSKLEKVSAREFMNYNHHSDLLRYFRHNELLNEIRSAMIEEIQHHIKFWETTQSLNSDIKFLADIVERIDSLFGSIRNKFEKYLNEFNKEFSITFLIYAIYLKDLRNLPFEGIQYLRIYQSTFPISKPFENPFSISSDETSAVIVSLDKKRAGDIIDATESVKNLFNIKREDVIGRNISSLFPSPIASSYRRLVKECSLGLSEKLNKKDKTYGKTAEGEIFELESYFQIFPYRTREITLFVTLKKKSQPKHLVIVNSDGSIADLSKSLEQIFQTKGLSMSSFKTIQELSSELESINLAFNLLYGQNSNEINQIATKEDQNSNIGAKRINKNLRSTSFETKCNSPSSHQALRIQSEEDHLITYDNIRESSTPSRSITLSRKSFSKVVTARSIYWFQRNPITITAEKARQICSEMRKGKSIMFDFPFITGLDRKNRFKVYLQIKPLIFYEEVFKVVTLKDFQKGGHSDCNEEDYISCRQSHGPTTLSHEFSVAEEGIRFDYQSLPIYSGPNLRLGFQKDSNTNTKKEKRSTHIVHKIRDVKTKRKSSLKSANKEHQTISLNPKIKDIQTNKAIQNLAQGTRLHPIVRTLLISLYVIILLVGGLQPINTYLSIRSIQEIDTRIRINDLTTNRFRDMMDAWQITLNLYSIAQGIDPFDFMDVFFLKLVFKPYILSLIEHNNQAKEKLSLLRDEAIIREDFLKNIKLWSLSGNRDMTYEQVNLFGATDFLANKYLAINNYQDVRQLNQVEDLIFTLNNTANDYIISSEQMLVKTQAFLRSTITNNIIILKTALVFQVLALTILTFVFIVLILILAELYLRLFEVVVKIQEKSVIRRLNQLRNIEALYKKDISSYAMAQKAFEGFDDPNLTRNFQTSAKKMSPKNQTLNRKGMYISMTKKLSLSLLAIPIFAAFSVQGLLQLTKAFESFETINNQIFALSEANYLSSMFVSSLRFQFLFKSRKNMLICNRLPEGQIEESLKRFGRINQNLVHVFFDEEDNIDLYIRNILEKDTCAALESQPAFKKNCLNATKGIQVGLLSLNSRYLEASRYYIALYQQNPSINNTKIIMANMRREVTTDLVTLKNAYPSLIEYIINAFGVMVEDTQRVELSFCLASCVAILSYGILIHLISVRHLKKINIGIRKIWLIIPYKIIQENKSLKLYLLKNFEKEFDGVKRIL